MKRVPLRAVCAQSREQVRPGERHELKYVGLESIEPGTGDFIEGELSKTPEEPRAVSFRFDARHVLYGKLRPYLNKVATPEFEGKCSTELVPLLPSESLDRHYLAYFLRSPSTIESIVARTAGARMPRADMSHLLSLEIPLPPLSDQRRIVDLLSRAEGIVRMRREASAKAAELIPALFLHLFGDPATSPNGWPVVPLSDAAQVISGVAKGRKLDPSESVELPYMRVANVKDGYLDLAEIKTIAIKRDEVDRLIIEPGDLLMTEGGDPDKLGRAALWKGEIDRCVHQNHIFKVRSDRSQVLPEYLRSLVGSPYGKNYFLRVAKKTTGIASINKTQLSAFPVVVAPLTLQRDFAVKGANLEGIAALQASATAQAQSTFNALLHRAFAT